MEMSNLPEYNVTLGDCDNKEMAVTRYIAAIIWYFLKREMCGTTLNVTTVADCFKVSRSQLSHLLTAKIFKSGPGRYVPKKRKVTTEGETSGATARPEVQEVDELEGYVLQ